MLLLLRDRVPYALTTDCAQHNVRWRLLEHLYDPPRNRRRWVDSGQLSRAYQRYEGGSCRREAGRRFHTVGLVVVHHVIFIFLRVN